MAVVNVDTTSAKDGGDNPYGASLTGSPTEIAETLRAFIDAGYRHIMLVPNPNSPEAVERCGPILNALGSA